MVAKDQDTIKNSILSDSKISEQVYRFAAHKTVQLPVNSKDKKNRKEGWRIVENLNWKSEPLVKFGKEGLKMILRYKDEKKVRNFCKVILLFCMFFLPDWFSIEIEKKRKHEVRNYWKNWTAQWFECFSLIHDRRVFFVKKKIPSWWFPSRKNCGNLRIVFVFFLFSFYSFWRQETTMVTNLTIYFPMITRITDRWSSTTWILLHLFSLLIFVSIFFWTKATKFRASIKARGHFTDIPETSTHSKTFRKRTSQASVCYMPILLPKQAELLLGYTTWNVMMMLGMTFIWWSTSRCRNWISGIFKQQKMTKLHCENKPSSILQMYHELLSVWLWEREPSRQALSLKSYANLCETIWIIT